MRDELLGGEAAPASWDEVLSLARRRPGAVALPLSPPHAVSSWLSLVGAFGAEPFASDRPRMPARPSRCRELAQLGPHEALGWEPPDALGRMTTTDEIAYMPLTYGYSTYATSADRPCRFVDVPAAADGPAARCWEAPGWPSRPHPRSPAEAAAFAAWASGADAQRDIVARTGGQPGHRAAWEDPELDALAGGFYSGTRASIEGAWVRPRDDWWPVFQLEAGRLLTDNLLDGAPGDLTARLQRASPEAQRMKITGDRLPHPARSRVRAGRNQLEPGRHRGRGAHRRGHHRDRRDRPERLGRARVHRGSGDAHDGSRAGSDAPRDGSARPGQGVGRAVRRHRDDRPPRRGRACPGCASTWRCGTSAERPPECPPGSCWARRRATRFAPYASLLPKAHRGLRRVQPDAGRPGRVGAGTGIRGGQARAPDQRAVRTLRARFRRRAHDRDDRGRAPRGRDRTSRSWSTSPTPGTRSSMPSR